MHWHNTGSKTYTGRSKIMEFKEIYTCNNISEVCTLQTSRCPIHHLQSIDNNAFEDNKAKSFQYLFRGRQLVVGRTHCHIHCQICRSSSSVDVIKCKHVRTCSHTTGWYRPFRGDIPFRWLITRRGCARSPVRVNDVNHRVADVVCRFARPTTGWFEVNHQLQTEGFAPTTPHHRTCGGGWYPASLYSQTCTCDHHYVRTT